MRRLFPLVALAASLAGAQSLKDFEKRVTEFTLPSGMHFIILERHDAPVSRQHRGLRTRRRCGHRCDARAARLARDLGGATRSLLKNPSVASNARGTAM